MNIHIIYLFICNGEIYSRFTCVNLIGVFGVRWFSLGRRARGGFCAGHLQRDVFIRPLYLRTHALTGVHWLWQYPYTYQLQV